MQNNRRFMMSLMAFISLMVWAQAPNNTGTYYIKTHGKKGEELKTAFFNVIKEPSVVSYSGLKQAYTETDVRADGYLRDWYSNATNYEPGSNFGQNIKKEGDGYNREHLMPQSWYNKVSPMVSDVVQVIPTDAYINSRRNDLPFGEVVDDPDRVKTSLNGYSKWGAPKEEIAAPSEVTTVFEPNDDIKGDIARIYFYMTTCYEDRILEWTGNNAATVIGGTAYQPLLQWELDVLMRWSKLDPVDDVELARNEAAYNIQGNRNPYVDYPGLEDYIWGDKVEELFSYDGSDPTVEPEYNDEPSVSGTITLNNEFFGVDWTGTRPDGGRRQISGKKGGITITYAMGEGGQNMYCNAYQIRMYKKNTLTFTINDNRFKSLEFNVVANASDKEFFATNGEVNGYKWTGDTDEVQFTVTDGNGNVQISSVNVELSVETGIDFADVDTAPADDRIYNIWGVLVDSTHLEPGIYIKGGKKFVVNRR